MFGLVDDRSKAPNEPFYYVALVGLVLASSGMVFAKRFGFFPLLPRFWSAALELTGAAVMLVAAALSFWSRRKRPTQQS